MTEKKHKILLDLKEHLAGHLHEDLRDVVLFGSQQDNKGAEDSDFDILIVTGKKADWQVQRAISDICYDIELKYNIIIDSHILSEEEFDTPRGKQPIFVNALAKGIHI